MRVRRPLILSALAAVLLFAPGCTFSPAQISFGDARLGLQGASAEVSLTVTCHVEWNIAFGGVDLAQANGPRLAQGSGSFANEFPGVPCTGSAETVTLTVFNFSPWVFRRGTAAVSGEVTVYNPITGALVTKSAGPEEIRIRRSQPQPQPEPAKVGRVLRDPRFSDS